MGNPNVAGALLAVLIMALFLIPSRGRSGMVLKLAAAGVLLAALLLTASRGALVGLCVGALAAWVAAGFPRPRPRWMLCGLAVMALLAFAFGGKAMGRLATLAPSEGSTASRIEIYRGIPNMIVAAPFGWGSGNAAAAYGNWFQSPTDSTSFKNLLSTHGTWMVERGWLFSLFYVLIWSFALLVAWARPAAFGLLVTWGVCAAFSHVGGLWWMWIVPLLALGVSLYARSRHETWPSKQAIAWVLSLPIILLSTFLICMTSGTDRERVFYDGSVVWRGDRPPTLWLLRPDFSVMGNTYGKKLRSMGSLAVAEQWKNIPEGATLVLSGNVAIPTKPPRLNKLTWLNPPALLPEELTQLVHQTPATHIIWGELRSDADPTQLRNSVQSLPNVCWRTAGGKAKYLGDADWMQLFSENN